MIEVLGVSKTFVTGKGKTKQSVYPLKNVSLTIENGKKVGLIGKSGEGKSTLANILCGVLPPDEGQVYLDGKPLYSAKNKYDKKEGVKIQLIPQKPSMALDPTQRIGDAVREALVFSKRAKIGKDAREKALALFDEVGLERTLEKRLPEHLSGGQAQRAVIARALAVNPQVLVCDESTSMLDATTQKNIIELVDALVKERGISVLFISHDVELVEGFCDDTYRISDGNVGKEEKKEEK